MRAQTTNVTYSILSLIGQWVSSGLLDMGKFHSSQAHGVGNIDLLRFRLHYCALIMPISEQLPKAKTQL